MAYLSWLSSTAMAKSTQSSQMFWMVQPRPLFRCLGQARKGGGGGGGGGGAPRGAGSKASPSKDTSLGSHAAALAAELRAAPPGDSGALSPKIPVDLSPGLVERSRLLGGSKISGESSSAGAALFGNFSNASEMHSLQAWSMVQLFLPLHLEQVRGEEELEQPQVAAEKDTGVSAAPLSIDKSLGAHFELEPLAGKDSLGCR